MDTDTDTDTESARMLRAMMADIGLFSRAVWPQTALRAYQLPAARAIVAAVRAGAGESLCVVMARQSGKDELLAQVIVFLLLNAQFTGGEIVVATPSLSTQGEIGMARVEARLAEAEAFAQGVARHGHTIQVRNARVRFLSAGPDANVRGATASLLTIANEAQDIALDRWDAVFDPMGASTNSPTVFSGTVWTSDTLLAREMGRAQMGERFHHKDTKAQRTQRDRQGFVIGNREEGGSHDAPCTADPDRPRLFMADWETVAAEVPAYGARVRRRIAERGLDDPFVRTEYRLLPLAGGGRLLDAGRPAQMHGDHPRIRAAVVKHTYALLVDVGGGIFMSDNGAGVVGGIFMSNSGAGVVGGIFMSQSDAEADTDSDSDTAYGMSGAESATHGGRDSTVLTVVEVDTGIGTDIDTDADADRNADSLPAHGAGHGQGQGHGTLPVYRIVDRRVWTGAGHLQLAAEISDLAARVWRATRVVVDATGIGHGLAAMLTAALPAGVVVPFVFTGPSKSALGWRLLSAVGAGRYQEYVDDGADDTRAFWMQAAATYTVRPGPGQVMQWSVPGRDLHDDLLLSAALCGALDDLDWSPRVARGTIGRGR